MNHFKVPYTGLSMWPLLKKGDVVIVREGSQKIKMGDIILFHDGHELICHRKVSQNLTKGDRSKEFDPVLAHKPIGKIVAILRGKQYIELKKGEKVHPLTAFISKMSGRCSYNLGKKIIFLFLVASVYLAYFFYQKKFEENILAIKDHTLN